MNNKRLMKITAMENFIIRHYGTEAKETIAFFRVSEMARKHPTEWNIVCLESLFSAHFIAIKGGNKR